MDTQKNDVERENAEFRAAALRYRRDYRKPQALQVVTFRVIKVRRKLFVDYGVKYSID